MNDPVWLFYALWVLYTIGLLTMLVGIPSTAFIIWALLQHWVSCQINNSYFKTNQDYWGEG